MSVIGGKPDSFCSPRAFPLLTPSRHLLKDRIASIAATTIGFHDGLVYCAMIQNSLMSGHNFSIWAYRNAPSAFGACCSRGKTFIPRSASRDRTVPPRRVALSLLMMSFGIPLGCMPFVLRSIPVVRGTQVNYV